MKNTWIWFPKVLYPNNQITKFDALSDKSNETYVVAEFKKEYSFDKPINRVSVRFSADTEVQLFCNGDILATGPCAVGGDFLGNGKAREWYYMGKTEFSPKGNLIDFFARVKMCPTRIYEYSKGHGGFMLQAAQDFKDVQFYHATGAQASNLPEGVENFHNAFASIYEGRYLGGVAAGMKLNEMIEAKEKELDRELTEDELKAATKIGYVGAYPYAEVKSGYTSFYLGVKSVCPSVTMDVKFTNSWYDETAEKAAAEALIADGAVLISQHADSMGAPSACEKAGVPNVSYNGTTIEKCPNTFIISSRINWTPYFEMIIASFAEDEEGELTKDVVVPVDYAGTITDGMVEILPINAEVMAKGTIKAIQDAVRNFFTAMDEDFNMVSSSAVIFNTANFTVEGKTLTEYNADVIDKGDFQPETNVIKNAIVMGDNYLPVAIKYFDESNAEEFRSAPYFDIDIDGITIK